MIPQNTHEMPAPHSDRRCVCTSAVYPTPLPYASDSEIGIDAIRHIELSSILVGRCWMPWVWLCQFWRTLFVIDADKSPLSAPTVEKASTHRCSPKTSRRRELGRMMILRMRVRCRCIARRGRDEG